MLSQHFQHLTPNAEVPLEDLRALNQALRESARGGGPFFKGNVGYPSQGVGYTGDIAPLVPQSIQGTLDSATFTRKDIKFWADLFKRNVTSTLHEETRINEHGTMWFDPWIGEGEVGPKSEAEYERQVVRVKYLAEHIEVSDPATMVGSLGVSKSVLAQRTANGTLALLGKLERKLFHGDSLLTPLAFDGLYAQVRGGDTLEPDGSRSGTGLSTNYTDLRGVAVTPQKLQEILGELYDAPNHAIPNVVYMEPRAFQTLVNLATAAGRHDQLRVTGAGGEAGSSLTFGHTRLFIASAAGQVEIKACPLLGPIRTVNPQAYGSGAPATPIHDTTTTPVDGTALFGTADAGSYDYRIVAVGDGGISAALAVNAVSPIAGDNVTIEIDDTDSGELQGAGDNKVRYYRVYRSQKGGGNISYAFSTPAINGSNTLIVDRNFFLPKTGRIFVGQNTPDVLEWTQLLDFTRRPLAQVKTTVPFLLMLFGTPFIKVPTKWWLLENAAFTL
jgi:hypothetical protein